MSLRVNLEEAIQTVQAARILSQLNWDDIEWHSNGVPVDLVDIRYPEVGIMPPFDMNVADYIVNGSYVVAPKHNEEE